MILIRPQLVHREGNPFYMVLSDCFGGNSLIVIAVDAQGSGAVFDFPRIVPATRSPGNPKESTEGIFPYIINHDV